MRLTDSGYLGGIAGGRIRARWWSPGRLGPGSSHEGRCRLGYRVGPHLRSVGQHRPVAELPHRCAGTTYDNSTGCINATLAAIDNARNQEGLPGMVLPTDWAQLTPAQQLFVSTNLERTVRGLPPLSGMATALDQASQSAAAQNADPRAPAGFPWTSWGGNWAGAVGSPLEAIYFWMYDDGRGPPTSTAPPRTPRLLGTPQQHLDVAALPALSHGHGLHRHGVPGQPELDRAPRRLLGLARTSTSPGARSSPTFPAPPGVASPRTRRRWVSLRHLTARATGSCASDGGVFAFGDAAFYGSMGGQHLTAPIVGISSTPDGRGYWLVASDGGLFAFGDAGFYGSMGGHAWPAGGGPGVRRRRARLLGGGRGRRLFAFGDAGFYGSMGGRTLSQPVVGLAPTPNGRGYWEVASDGGIFAFGDAALYGSMGGTALARPVVAMAVDPRRSRLLDDGLGRRDLRLRRRPVPRIDREATPGGAHRVHDRVVDRRLLAGGV